MCLSRMQKGLFGNEHSKANSRNTRSPKLGSLNFEICIKNTTEIRESFVIPYSEKEIETMRKYSSRFI